MDLTLELAGNLKIKLLEIINNDAELVLLREEIRKFRNLRRINRAFKRPGLSHGAFTASLQGKTQDGTQKVYECLCEGKHRYSECYYLNESIRPSSWKLNQATMRSVEEAFTKLSSHK